MQEVFLGIDTSCYTTSIALLDTVGNLLEDKRTVLKVKENGCGLRQSEMVFQHTKNLPVLFENAFAQKKYKIRAIAVSSQPRSFEKSYMPAFLCGLSAGRILSSTNGVPLYVTSHQENHIKAGLWSVKRLEAGCFIVLHISGGTTDLLLVDKSSGDFKITDFGGSSDLNAGQYIDRIGVELGLPFPAGKSLEQLALTAKEYVDIPVAVKDLNVSYSGPLTATKKLLAKGVDKASLVAGMQKAIAKSLTKLLLNACQKVNYYEILLVGGVASNLYIRNYLKEQLAVDKIQIYFPEPAFCSDNAVGCAFIALKRWRKEFA